MRTAVFVLYKVLYGFVQFLERLMFGQVFRYLIGRGFHMDGDTTGFCELSVEFPAAWISDAQYENEVRRVWDNAKVLQGELRATFPYFAYKKWTVVPAMKRVPMTKKGGGK